MPLRSGPTLPRIAPMTLTLPAGACNAHCHVFGPRDRFPYAPDASFVPDTVAPK